MFKQLSNLLAAFALVVSIVLFCICCNGCSALHTRQVHTGTNGVTTKTYTTAFSFFDSKNSIGKLKVSNTDKTQSVGVSDLEQTSSSTGVVDVVSGVSEGMTRGFIKAMAK